MLTCPSSRRGLGSSEMKQEQDSSDDGGRSLFQTSVLSAHQLHTKVQINLLNSWLLQNIWRFVVPLRLPAWLPDVIHRVNQLYLHPGVMMTCREMNYSFCLRRIKGPETGNETQMMTGVSL